MTNAINWGYRVEHVDTDASGIVHFSRYASLLETVVLEFLEEVGAGLTELASHGCELMIVELRIRYLEPARFLDRLSGIAVIDHVGGAQLRMSATLHREAAPLASGILTFAIVDKQTGRPAAFPRSVRNLLKGLLRDAEQHDPS
jgi:acyl-CoA thioester hydrolase